MLDKIASKSAWIGKEIASPIQIHEAVILFDRLADGLLIVEGGVATAVIRGRL